MKHRLLLSFATLVLSLGACRAASADTFTLTLSNANQTALPGATLAYTGTISNTSGSDISLNGIEFTTTHFSSVDSNPTCAGSMPCTDESPFFNNAPFFLSASGPGSSYTGVLFNVDVPLSSAITIFSGFVDITGGSGTNNNLTSTIVGFSTTVTPEPSSWFLMATGLLGLAIAYRFRSVAASSLS